jgi:hypothetical protein
MKTLCVYDLWATKTAQWLSTISVMLFSISAVIIKPMSLEAIVALNCFARGYFYDLWGIRGATNHYTVWRELLILLFINNSAA